MPRPVLLILFGPPGSGKSSVLDEFFAGLPEGRRFPRPELRLDQDSFVYGSAQYLREREALDRRGFTDADDKKRRYSDLFARCLSRYARADFERAVADAIRRGRPLALDTTGNNPRVISDNARAIREGYSVHLVYPYVQSLDSLRARVEGRWAAPRDRARAQTPLPPGPLAAAARAAPDNLRRLLGHLRRDTSAAPCVESITAINSDPGEGGRPTVIFRYWARGSECELMDAAARFSCDLLGGARGVAAAPGRRRQPARAPL